MVQPYTPLTSLEVQWVCSEDGLASGTVMAECCFTASSSFHLYTLGVDDKVDLSSFQGSVNVDGILKFEMDQSTAFWEDETDAVSSGTLVDSDHGEYHDEFKEFNFDPALMLAKLGKPYTPETKWAKSPDFESRYSRNLWDSSYSEDIGNSPKYMRNTSALHPPQGWPITPVKCLNYQPKQELGEDTSRLDIMSVENGHTERVGQVELVRGTGGLMVVAHLGRLPPQSTIGIEFQIEQKHVTNSSKTFAAKPLEPVYWTRLLVGTIPTFEKLLKIRLYTDEVVGFNVLATLYPLYGQKVIHEDSFEFTVDASNLSSLPLNRHLELQLKRALGLKEVPLTATTALTVARFNKDVDGSVKALFIIDVECKEPAPDPYFLGNMSTQLYITDGPEHSVEIRRNSRHVNYSQVRLSEDRSVSEVQILASKSFQGLQLVFEKSFAFSVGAIYIPRLLGVAGQHKVSLVDHVGLDMVPGDWHLIDGEYISATKNDLLTAFQPVKLQSSASVRDMNYKFRYKNIDPHKVSVGLDVQVVVDIADCKVGECILRLSNVEMFPSGIMWIDGKPEAPGDRFTNDDYTHVFLRHKTQYRDVEISLHYEHLAVRQPTFYYNDWIPSITCELSNIKLSLDIPGVFGYLERGESKTWIKDGHMQLRFATGGPVYLCLSDQPINESKPTPSSPAVRRPYITLLNQLCLVALIMAGLTVFWPQVELVIDSWENPNRPMLELQLELERAQQRVKILEKELSKG